jgi:hypothetical protein
MASTSIANSANNEMPKNQYNFFAALTLIRDVLGLMFIFFARSERDFGYATILISLGRWNKR